MIPRPHIDWFALAPVNSLLAASALALLCAVLAPRSSRKVVTATLCALGYATALGFAIALYVSRRTATASSSTRSAVTASRS